MKTFFIILGFPIRFAIGLGITITVCLVYGLIKMWNPVSDRPLGAKELFMDCGRWIFLGKGWWAE